MAKIDIVDYEKMPNDAKEIRSVGKELNTEMTNAYESITNMHNVWYGVRYNELVKSFNGLVSQINEMLSLVVTEIPYALEKVANNYSQADTGSKITNAVEEQPNNITDIAIINDVGMRFLTDDVASVQQQVSSYFENAIEQMENIESLFNGITWTSEAAEAFRTKFEKLKSNIVSSFESINNQFKNLMEQTQEDIENTEKANTVS